MQLMPETAQDMIAKGLVDGGEYSADNLNDPATNIEFWLRIPLVSSRLFQRVDG